ncbi:MAG: DUF1186 domain-containing protein [Armatimonadota bacterium]
MMTITKISEELSHDHGVFPHQAVTEAILQREAITPALLRMLADATPNIAEIARQEDYTGHLYAIYLLAQFREERAYQPLVDFITSDQKLIDLILNDIITEDLGRVLASVCNGDTRLICKIFENAELDEYVRTAALAAMVTLYVQGIITREEVISYYLSLFHGKLEREPSVVWCSLVSGCCDISAVEASEEIERAFADDLVDTGYIGREWVSKHLGKGKEQALKMLAKDTHYTFIDDSVKEMSKWDLYHSYEQSPRPSAHEPSWIPTPIRTGPKAGRNEPCPCGSGKKYKKCCG